MILSKREQDRLVSQTYTYACKQASIFRRKYQWLERDDLIQEALIAVMSAAEKFDPEKGKFTTFCTPFILFRLMDYAKAQRRSIGRAERMVAYECPGDQKSTEEEVDEILFDERLWKYPTLSRYFLMGHNIVDMSTVESVSPSTVWRRIEKEAGELASEIASK